ncbi:response regulator transcription factor [Paenalkalicoccus suaedae]|uniref:Response regulator transcription factor n=1 Tax=Paenalkalicoccus suaedae TaxID=2592382 RepID=A0A859FJK9_9BACI|nr:response regulator [Paenalkalicoccus suaedae]QKS72987.1 response regulator transcription factor [Paenalkalicoccus suaedae]
MSMGTAVNVSRDVSVSEVFDMMVVSSMRARVSFTFVVVQLNVTIDEQMNEEEMKHTTIYVKEICRKSDLLFPLEGGQGFVLLLANTGEDEAQAFLKRVFSGLEKLEVGSISKMRAVILEIGDPTTSFDVAYHTGLSSLEDATYSGNLPIFVNRSFSEKPLQKMKASIIEDDPILKQVLRAALNRAVVGHVELHAQEFEDGDDFLSSDWYRSGEPHIIIMNDLLKKRNGKEVLHHLRALPNDEKFIIVMLSKRHIESEMLYYYEQGVDEYFVKPLNVRLLEAKLTRLVKGARR